MTDEVGTETPDTETPSVPDSGQEPGSSPASTAGADESGTTPPEPGAPADAAVGPEEWRKFSDQYKGDKSLMGKAWWEKVNYASKIAKENKELQQEIAKYRSRPPVPASPPKESPAAASLKRIDDRIKSFASKIKTQTADRDAALNRYNDYLTDIKAHEKLLARVDEVDKAEIQAQINQLTQAKDLEAWKWSQAKELLDTVEIEQERLASEKANAEQAIKDEKERQEQAEAEDAEFREEFPRAWGASFERLADDAKIPNDPETRDYAWRICRALHSVDLWQMGLAGTSKEADHEAMLSAYVGEFSKLLTTLRTATFNQDSANKLNVATPLTRPATPGAPKTPPPANDKGSQDWRQSPANLAARKRLEQMGWG